MKNIKYLFFDIDGVILNHDCNGYHTWTLNVEKDLGIERDMAEKIHKDVERWKQLSLGKDSLDIYLDEFIKINQIKNISGKELVDYIIIHDSDIDKRVLDTVLKLKKAGYKSFLATHQEKNKGKNLWENLNFKDYFEKMFASYDIGFLKTDLDFFYQIQKIVNEEDGEKLLMIDDKSKNIETAINAGWNGYLYSTFEEAEENLFNKLLEE